MGCTEQVGELEIFVAQAVAAEMADEVLAGVIGHDAFVALRTKKLDVIENVFQRVVGLA